MHDPGVRRLDAARSDALVDRALCRSPEGDDAAAMRECVPMLIVLACLCASTAAARPGPGAVYLASVGDSLRFGNERIELTLDPKSGYFRAILNRETGVQHKKPDEGVWPFGLWVGTREAPEQMKAEIRADGVQKMTHKVVSGAGGVRRLMITYASLIDNASGKSTGVGLGVSIELAPDRDYFIIRATIANNGPLWVTRFYAGQGEVLTGDGSRDQETVWVPTRGGTARTGFKGRSLGIPTYAWGWSDYSGERGGLGMAYVNKQGMQLMFDWQPADDGLVQSWHMFDMRWYWHFEYLMNDYEKSLRIQPLEPGNEFTTDEWLIVPHSGDWHRTADAYRERYEQVFKNDYVDWNKLPKKIRDLYVQTGLFVRLNSIGSEYPSTVVNSLDSIPNTLDEVIGQLDVSADRVLLNVAFSQPHVGRYPEYFPIYGPAGGEAGWKKMMSRLRAMNVGCVIGYTHLAYNHPAAKNYVPEADTAGTVVTFNPTAGDRACVDNSAWAGLWEKKLVPAYKAHGFDGVYADEGHFPWGTCSARGPAHLHGPSAVGILTSSARGAIRLHKLIHKGLGPDSVIMVEGAGDVSGRWVDMNHAYPDPAVPYTLPFKRYVWFVDAMTPETTLSANANVALAHGYVLGFNIERNHPLKGIEPLRRYVGTRKKLDAAKAPGYPNGFRDTIGVSVSSPSIVAKSFADRRGITIVYYATEPGAGEITIDGRALGHPEIGVRKRAVELKKDEVGFVVIPTQG